MKPLRAISLTRTGPVRRMARDQGRARPWVGANGLWTMQINGNPHISGALPDVFNAPSRGEGRARPGGDPRAIHTHRNAPGPDHEPNSLEGNVRHVP